MARETICNICGMGGLRWGELPTYKSRRTPRWGLFNIHDGRAHTCPAQENDMTRQPKDTTPAAFITVNTAVELSPYLVGMTTRTIEGVVTKVHEAGENTTYEVTIHVQAKDVLPARAWEKFTGNEAELRSIIHGDLVRANREIKVEDGIIYVRPRR